MSRIRCCTILFLFFLLAGVSTVDLQAQEFRGTISGRVTDPSGGVVPGAEIVVTNQATNTDTTAVSNETGNYTVLYLLPGIYTVRCGMPGFKTVVRSNVEVRVADKLVIDFGLEVGEVKDVVNVTAQTPLLESSSASVGQVIDGRRISELPLSDGNPFSLLLLAPGVSHFAYSDRRFSRPFDTKDVPIIDGTSRGNEFTLDGAPNTGDKITDKTPVTRVAFVPPADAVQEFRVVTAKFDAQQGHTNGADINVALKGGTNQFHGTVYEFVRNDIFNANDFFINRVPANDKDGDGKADKAPFRYNRYGTTVGGPVILPWLYNGRDKTFFFFGFEGLKNVFPIPNSYTVPTQAQREGDLSSLLAEGVVIYDPATWKDEGSKFRRTAFPNNVIPASRINPITKKYLSFYPLPNQAGNAQGRLNYFSSNPDRADYHSETVRIDHNISDKQRFFARFTNNRNNGTGNAWAGVVNGITPIGSLEHLSNRGAAFDHVYSLSSTTILNTRVSFSRNKGITGSASEGQYDARDLGFPAETAALFGYSKFLPSFSVGGGSNYTTLGGSGPFFRAHNIYAFQPLLTTIKGKHALKFGYDFRAYRENTINSGATAGIYYFGAQWTNGPLNTDKTAPIGQELASLLLGLVSNDSKSSVLMRPSSSANQTLYNAFFFHDDWKIANRLTLNFGVRYEYEGATTERFNRNVRGFDFTSSSPIEAAAKTAYAAKPIAEIPVDRFQVKGGLLFADEANRGFWNSDGNNIQPRLGLAYQINDKTVLRAGWGIYAAPFVIDGVFQPGFSSTTPIPATLDNYRTPLATISKPFPNGVLEPTGSTMGLASELGKSVDRYWVPLDRKNTQSQRVEFGLQRQLPGDWLVEAAYVANLSYDLTTNSPVNFVPKEYRSKLAHRDQATINVLEANVPNPFAGLVTPGTTLNNATIKRFQLLKAYPQFENIVSQRYDGSASYHSGQFRVERRFSSGYTFTTAYTWAKAIEQTGLLNDFDTEYEKAISGSDTPHRLASSGIVELPFGRGRKWGSGWNGVVDGFFGGWQLAAVYQAQSGRPISLPNLYFQGDPSKLTAKVNGAACTQPAFDISGFYFHDAAVQTNGVDDPGKQRSDGRIANGLPYNIRTLPTNIPSFRGQGVNLWDVSLMKDVRFSEGVKLQIRGEFLNATNHVQFKDLEMNPQNAAFGTLQGKRFYAANLPRNLQIGLKLVF